MLLIISIPLGISGYVSYQLASGALQKTIEEELRGTTASAAKAVDAELEAVGTNLGIASKKIAYWPILPGIRLWRPSKAQRFIIFPVCRKTTPSYWNR
ncbi:hypothetical protein ACFTAO_28615 [Paenibacillus rhizoplanae]